MVAPPDGGRVLDVGTGTGVAALAATEAVGPTGLVVGIDPSVGMLAIARDKGLTRVLGGAAVDLPFRDGIFDAVIASFVIFFFTRYDTALSDMVRVLRPGGRLGATTWGPRDDEFTRAWDEVAESFVGRDLLRDARKRAAPWEERFSDPSRLEEAFRGVGLRPVEVERREYRTTLTLDDYLTGRETTAIGRFVRHMLGETLWERFRDRISDTFRERFRDPIGDTRDVLIAVGTKP